MKISAIITLLISGTSAAGLSAYNVDANSLSVSGLSAGGFMAAQLGVAYSNTFKTGFGVFAGGPFDCATAQSYTACMRNSTPSIVGPLNNMNAWNGKQIDSLSNLASRKVYLESGVMDSTVGINVMNQLQSELSNFVTSSNVKYDKLSQQAHTFPTDFDGSGNNACGNTASPYISNCGFDGAGAVLQQMYGNLQARNNGALTGSVISFDQTGSYGSPGLATTGYLYVPQACQAGTQCKLHMALHGCLQNYAQVGSDFISNTGYNKWADTNNIIILYPQTTTDYTSHQTPGSGSVPNPNACFDWIGWYGSDYDQKSGVQMSALVAQANRVMSGSGGTQPPPGTTTSVPTSTTTTAKPTPTQSTVTCAYAGQYVLCGGFYYYCYYYGQQYTC